MDIPMDPDVLELIKWHYGELEADEDFSLSLKVSNSPELSAVYQGIVILAKEENCQSSNALADTILANPNYTFFPTSLE